MHFQRTFSRVSLQSLKASLSLRALSSLALSAMIASLALAPIANAQAADKEPPSDVEGLKLQETGDGSVSLSWDVATDNVGVTGYKVYYGPKSVTADNSIKYAEEKDAGNVLTYTVTGLTNDVKHYFAVTAYDQAGNESESYSTKEVAATPSKKAGNSGVDNTAPTVSLAKAEHQQSVKLTFSEAVKLPTQNPQSSFSIKDQITDNILAVSDVEIDKTDSTGRTVLLTTATQKEDAKYELTVGISVTDVAGNPIKSGTSDTAVFTGSAKSKDDLKSAAANEALELSRIEVIDEAGINVVFNKEIRLSIDPLKNFTITEKANPSKKLGINKVRKVQTDPKSVLIVTETQSNVEYIVVANDITDVDGNVIALSKNAGQFKGYIPFDKGGENPDPNDSGSNNNTENSTSNPPVDNGTDTKEPTDVINLTSELFDGFNIRLTWIASSDKDIDDQILYLSEDGGETYDRGRSIGASATKFELRGLSAGKTYNIKVTTKNKDGLESKGASSVVVLPKVTETGPATTSLLAVSLVGAYLIHRRRRKFAPEIGDTNF